MSKLKFVSEEGVLLAEIEAEQGEQLLDVARAHQIPLHWRCGQGTCGTCRVRIRQKGAAPLIDASRKERNVLLRAGLISQETAESGQAMDQPDSWRLACHLRLTEDDWTIEVPSPV